ncbi:hypothetical protein FZC78_22015 [Rossellomorea vietnamensis]|uniref:ABC-three component systems C-terminal domain-containing protein n=1 Tax=Rossellomorea vietnamensis TaxID=218284 RepID=A0A5D4NHH4_9BACI|nr:ABC-three component system protein [Rossellomorea vietnamensis]TYS13249.1 hypothetical protein FZC78_22015 [Rossellomorea vietnamensis]
MNHNAPGQLLGYSMQFPRALYHLLTSEPGDVICVEVLGDVSSEDNKGNIITEEDKSSINGNPVTDRSTDLWKTFYNWLVTIQEGDLKVESSKFILYCNQSGREGIVGRFSKCITIPEVEEALAYAKDKLADIKSDHEIWKYYNYVMNNEELFRSLILKFEHQVGSSSGFDELRLEIKKKIIPEGQREFIIDKLLGWVQKKVMEMISQKKPAKISWEAFNEECQLIFDRARGRELVDFTHGINYTHDLIEEQFKTRPNYLIQLEEIESSGDQMIEAVSDFLRAETNRDKWIETEIIDNEVAVEFEDKLERFWKNQQERIDLLHTDRIEIHKGKLLLNECKLYQVTIRDMSPPASTITGTYHYLANQLVLGWHPRWETIFNKGGV